MQRNLSVLLASLVAGLLMTGCPEKKVEKEEPAAPAAVAPAPRPQNHAATDDKADDEHGDEGAPEEHPDDGNDERPHRRRPDKAAGDAKDQGGW